MKKPRMIDFLNGKDHGPLTKDEGLRYNQQDKREYLQTRIISVWLDKGYSISSYVLTSATQELAA